VARGSKHAGAGKREGIEKRLRKRGEVEEGGINRQYERGETRVEEKDNNVTGKIHK
jgi:hypothetical protein